ncbi:TPA: SymE family type I addiction module toxin [Salmonella enterica]|uniref:SymE family type I addiction module toxin n=1 Tax=Salmonella enterica TaxID=28901 RepID=UPI0003BD7E06|nr:SymE family type I addiction module toxin [Salmonella enterica]EAB5741015.1 type I addiction module toxin, SymE family [Salmonella enterica subsp. enterica serovar Mokola]EBR7973623.1 type I addiction module toxin, SymE family [Salmonella enterica subsp. enterica serovar Enteritidis]EBV0502693.1 type I addiction module toxin, SymE family [Salmonella enterica subsp. enterica serovar Teddington]EBW6550493.1 type I addiction module toxin, SymE family [Salmonella enterica subsp. enterica serovar
MNASGVSVRHINSETCMTTCYSHIPSQHLKGDWQEDAGFETGRSVTVKISEGCLILIAETDEVRDLRKELYQVKKSMKHIKAGVNNVVNGD